MSDLQTNFNVDPYNDDYARSKQFYRILFIPSVAVQTRELTQLQTIIQEQIKRFGDHVFKDGSIVTGCNIIHVPRLEYVRLDNVYNVANNNAAFSSNSLSNFLAVSPSGVRASIRLAKAGYELQYPATNTLYVDYINTGRDISNNEVTTFASGETLTIYNSTQDKFANTLDSGKIYNTIDVYTANVSANQESTGQTYGVTVGEGVVYQKGFFVTVPTHTITVRDYSTDVDDYLVGFNTEETIVTHLSDQSLIDPADTSSRNGIGAHRLKLSPVLISRHKDDITEDDDFFPIIEFSGGKPAIQKTDPEYAALGDWLGKSKDEESGSFYVKPYLVSTESSSNTATFNYLVNPGLAWIKGNRVELLATKRLEKDRAQTTAEENASITTLNYGYYVLVNEKVGMFDFDKLNTVDIYDTAQDSITDIEGSDSAPSGNKIGTANIRNIVFESGTKGVANAVYRAYLTNITMNNTKSFSTQAKSLFSNTGGYGTAKADFVLEANNAVLKDSSRGSLVFDTGLSGLKRLRDSGGTNDTQFYLRDIASATLQANGLVTFTLNSPHAGGTERFFSSAGVLSNANELRIDVATSNALYTANLTGTVNSATVGNTNILTGTTTTFTTQYHVGEIVRVSANSTSHYLRTITGISNNTTMTLSAAIVQANATAVHSKYYEAGRTIDLTDATVTALSNTQFTVQLTDSFASGAPQTVYASYPVLRTGATETKKNVKKSRYVKINCNTGGTTGPWNLGFTDIYKINNVYVGTSYLTTNPERSSWFSLNDGQSDTHYEHGKLVLKPQFAGNLTSASRILVELSYFEHDTTAGIGFFSVDSYPARDPGDIANTTNISYAEIPMFSGRELRGCIDFRPSKYNTANDATIIGNATENPAVSNTSFQIATSGVYLAEPDSNFQADVEYYLPRIDLVQVNKDGVFNVKSSVAAIKPKTPIADQEAMAIAQVYVPPYPSLTADERGIYGIDREKITSTLRGNRVYTMENIYALDQRITRLEYYQQLSMLEAQARDYTVKDENGLDRFKNGIFADPFNNHLLGDYTNFEYSIAIDPQQSVARPKFSTHPVDLRVHTLTDTSANGSVVSLPYTASPFIVQNHGSKFRNLTESVWNWQGNVRIYPSYDHFKSESALPDVNVTLDLTSPWDQFAASPFGTNFGEWRVTNSSVSSSSSSATNALGTTTTTATTTTETLQQTINKLLVSSSLSTYNLGSFVTDVTMNPFVRSREIAIIASGLKPNTNFYVYFDKIAVSNSCAPATINAAVYNASTGAFTASSGSESQVLTRSAAWGTQLVSDSAGNLYALFLIPADTFRVGDRELLIANVDDLVAGEDAIISSCRVIYTASSLSTTTQNTSLSTINPVLSTTSLTDTRVQSSTSITQRTEPPVMEFNTVLVAGFRNGPGTGGTGPDPIGQSFLIETPYGIPGMFVNKIGVYFKSKDPTLGVKCVITEMNAGFPDTSRTISTSYLKPSQITTSNNGSAETVFVFPDIPYLTRDKYYAFFLQPDGNSPEYSIFMAEVGGVDLITGQKIFSNPNIGVAFTSSNSSSWTILQTEDIKFTVYRCAFTKSTGTVLFVDQDDEYLSVNGFTMANSQVDIQVGDVVYSQNSTGGLLVANSDPFGVVQLVDRSTDTLILDSSTGGFAANAVIQIHRPAQAGNTGALNANTLVANATISTIDDIQYSMVVPRIGYATPFGTTVDFEYKGKDLSENTDGSWTAVQPEVETELVDRMRMVQSRSNRDANTYSSSFQVTLASPSDYLTPVLDLKRRSVLLIENIINNDLTNEHTRYGNALTKYISNKIVLAEGQDAEDINVVITGYRPSGTDITCYIKFHNAEDPDLFEDKLWTKMEMSAGSAVYSNSLNINDFREFSFTVPTTEAQQGEAYLNATNAGVIQYRNSSGSVFVTYKTFAVKLVLTSDRPERVPRMRDVRGICLQI